MTNLEIDKHAKFLIKTASDRGFEWTMSEYLRMSGIYWSLTALYIIQKHDQLPKDELIEFVKSCQAENGGFCPAPGHYPSIVYTLSAVQILITYDEIDSIDIEKLISFIKRLQNENGSFRGKFFRKTFLGFDLNFSIATVFRLSRRRTDRM